MSTLNIQNSGQKVRALREEQGLTQVKLGELAGLEQTDVSKIERGERRIGLKYARKLARALKVSYVDLLDPAEDF